MEPTNAEFIPYKGFHPLDIKTEVEVQTRIRFIFNDGVNLPDAMVYTYEENEWYGLGVDGAAAYPWLMDNTIAWVETRTVTKTPWVMGDE